jgi:hypothetical protein
MEHLLKIQIFSNKQNHAMAATGINGVLAVLIKWQTLMNS